MEAPQASTRHAIAPVGFVEQHAVDGYLGEDPRGVVAAIHRVRHLGHLDSTRELRLHVEG
jgi:hypothetical protein